MHETKGRDEQQRGGPEPRKEVVEGQEEDEAGEHRGDQARWKREEAAGRK